MLFRTVRYMFGHVETYILIASEENSQPIDTPEISANIHIAVKEPDLRLDHHIIAYYKV